MNGDGVRVPRSASDLVAFKNVVLFPAGALGAFQAAHEQNGDSHRDQNRQEIGIHRQPMSKYAHTL
jgi:hypothetical protein